jgi:predicted PurR-regulated permease PerM
MPTLPEPESDSRRNWPRTAALAALTVVAVVVCVLLTLPFLAGLAWGVALAVVALPVQRWVERVVRPGNWAAGITTALVVLLIGVPVGLVGWQLTAETKRAADQVKAQTDKKADEVAEQVAAKAKAEAKPDTEVAQEAEAAKQEVQRSGWRDAAAKLPYVGPQLSQVDPAVLEARTRDWLDKLLGSSFGVVKGAADAILQTLVAVFVLFFALRDHRSMVQQARGFLPVSAAAADRLFTRVSDAIHSTVYGTFVTAVVQGVSGGLLFWALGLPAPVLWGVVMTILGILPFVGAFIVWVPAALYLATEGQWWQAVVLAVWGVLMAGPVCNYLYAVTAGKRLKLHAVPTLLAFIGGLAVFGVSGMILGPCVLAITLALIDVWRNRTPDGTPTAVQPAAASAVAVPVESDAGTLIVP